VVLLSLFDQAVDWERITRDRELTVGRPDECWDQSGFAETTLAKAVPAGMKSGMAVFLALSETVAWATCF
jgi:hypothetical protein